MNDRIALAAQDPNVVVHAHGLLAEFNEAGVLAPVDVASAQAVSRLLGETDEAVTLAAALAVRGTRFGHVCVRVSTLRESVVVDGREAELVEALPWPEPDEWLERLRSSSLVGDGSGEHPLVLSDDRLYLERYWRASPSVISGSTPLSGSGNVSARSRSSWWICHSWPHSGDAIIRTAVAIAPAHSERGRRRHSSSRTAVRRSRTAASTEAGVSSWPSTPSSGARSPTVRTGSSA